MRLLTVHIAAAFAALVATAPSPSCAETGGSQSPATAETNIVLTTVLADGSTNAWTEADLRDALGMLNRKYRRDMGSDAGRRDWHGDIVPERCGIVTNAEGRMFRRDVYADGYFHDTPFAPKPASRPRPQRNAGDERYSNLTNRLAQVEAKVETGDPSTLQYAKDLMEMHRLRRMLERENARRTTNTVDVTIVPQGGE